MAETTWLQCVMPRTEWEALNKRRERLGLKWSQILPPAVTRYLNEVEAGKIKVEVLKAATEKPKAETKAPAEKPTPAAESKKGTTTTKAENKADKKTGSSKSKGSKKTTNVDPPMETGEGSPAEVAAELASIK